MAPLQQRVTRATTSERRRTGRAPIARTGAEPGTGDLRCISETEALEADECAQLRCEGKVQSSPITSTMAGFLGQLAT
jgi:hypothetical protein